MTDEPVDDEAIEALVEEIRSASLLPPLDRHSPHCCMSRGCHDACSHACRTDLEAILPCRDHEYCRRQAPVLQLRLERAERERLGLG